MPNFASRCRVDGTAPAEYSFPLLYATETEDDAILELPIATDKCWCIGAGGIIFSYSGGTVSTGSLVFETSPDESSWAECMSIDITSTGPGPIPFHKTVKFPLGHAVRITLLSGGTGVVGKLVLPDYWNESDIDPVA